MPSVLKIIAIPLLGLILMVGGFAYDIMFAGIPYQDPTPELLERWKFHSNIAFWTMAVGTIIMCIGLFLIPFLAKSKATDPKS